MAFPDNLRETYDPKSDSAQSEQSDFTFYYNRKERIENAPKIVQDYYNGTGIKFQKGLFKVLVSTKTNRIVFLMMIFCAAIVFILGNFKTQGNVAAISGYEAELSAFAYDRMLYASVKIHPVKKTRKNLENLKELALKNSGQEEKQTLLEQLAVENQKEVRIKLSGIYESDAVQAIGEELSGFVYDSQIFLRTNCEECDIIKVQATVTIGNETKLLKTSVLKKE